MKIIIFTFYRSLEDQLKEYNAGRSHVKHGAHQDWLAKDYALFDDLNQDWVCDQTEIRWKNDGRYTKMGEKWESMGGIWGGRWDLADIYHFQAAAIWTRSEFLYYSALFEKWVFEEVVEA